MKKTIVFIILGAAVIGLSMNAYAMMGGGQTRSGQTQHMHDSSQKYHTDQEYHSNGRKQYRSDHGDHMDGDGSNGQEHFMDDDFFDHDETHQINHEGNGHNGRNAEDMHDSGSQVH